MDDLKINFLMMFIEIKVFIGRLALLDKTEAMKVVQSYLSSKTDTEVVGWWQFQREGLRGRGVGLCS